MRNAGKFTHLTIEKTAKLLTSDVRKDLHIHTCYSDGALTPREVIDRWKAEGYEMISITDHDGIEGSMAGYEYAAEAGITFIPGIEFDSEDDIGRDLHILGYGYDYENHDLREALTGIILERARRNDLMMAALNDMGCGITLDDIGSVNEGRFVGKPTFALILARKGIISNPNDAFNTLFREPSIRSIRKKTLASKQVIDVIHAAGGLAVMAHPMEQRHLDETFEEFRPRLMMILDRMREYGIDGIECIHPSADEYQRELLGEYADRYGLLRTKGSDFHSDHHKRDFTRYHRP